VQTPGTRPARRAEIDEDGSVDGHVEHVAQAPLESGALDVVDVAHEDGVLEAVAPRLGDLRRAPQAPIVPDVVAEEVAGSDQRVTKGR